MVQQNRCKICDGPGTERQRLYGCEGWRNLRLQMEYDVKSVAKIAHDDSRIWLWERGLPSWNGACQVYRMVRWGMGERNQRC